MRVSLGNFPAKSSAVLKVFFYQQLEIDDLSYCLRIPISFVPRYFRGNGASLVEPEED